MEYILSRESVARNSMALEMRLKISIAASTTSPQNGVFLTTFGKGYT
jgi:hypothetical protein